ncbi:MAG: Gfo/Idh/MocA family oxidoreductase [Bryobacteraceae bacterium]|nr:Gfo/Idh/MocA family oxidoreductase [Bryobacteraceae bacterium]
MSGNLGTGGEVFDFSSMGRFTNPLDLIDDPKVDAVDICLPTNFHAPVAMAALQAGKHVLVEKPIALSTAEADEMLTTAKQTGRTLMAAHVLRFLAPYRGLTSALHSGEYGRVRSAVFRRRCAAPTWSKWLTDTDRSGGAILDLLIHDIDYVLHVFGETRITFATGYENLANGIDLLHANLITKEDVDIVITGGWHHPKAYPFSMEYTIVTDRATFDFNSAAAGESGVAIYTSEGEKQSLELPTEDGFIAELAYFHECCVNGKQPEFCPPEESAAAVKLALDLAIARQEPG